ncbi:MAG: hypothetical protein IT258_20435 [Saprospiraceae bacterium]|nr:hypothetical protein [Saprospiraceae bacterium]
MKINSRGGVSFGGLLHLFLLATLAMLIGCDREKEPIPSFITVEPFELLPTDFGIHGSISNKITHADMFMFDSLENRAISLGVIELPATFPVLEEGSFSINIDPVIKANGSSLSLQGYPFYTRFSKTINLSTDAPITVKPTTTYSEDAVFEVVEDFEGTGETLFSVDRDGNPNTFMTRSNSDVFEGQTVGRVLLDTANATVAAQTAGLYDLTIGTAGKVFIELNYKTDVPLEFGLIPVEDNGQESEPILDWYVLAKNDWNKIYFDITNAISSTGSLRFAVVFNGQIPYEDGKYTLQQAEILFDNFKIVHF